MNKFNFIQIYADKVEVDTQDQSVVLSGVDPAQVVAEFGVQTLLEEMERHHGLCRRADEAT